jgi:hypothetical protein
MRKITKEAVVALVSGKEYDKDNTKVVDNALFLHNTPIVEVRDDGVYIQTGGWNTSTTKERLNGFRFINVYTHKGVLFLNGLPWDGSWMKVAESI